MFWQEIVDEITELILFHIAAVDKEKEKSILFSKTNFMEKVLESLRRSAEKIVKERNKTIEFLKYYNPKRSV